MVKQLHRLQHFVPSRDTASYTPGCLIGRGESHIPAQILRGKIFLHVLKQSLIIDHKPKKKWACILSPQLYIMPLAHLLPCFMFLNLQCPPQGTTGKYLVENLKTA
jgi:hypothetical protein